MTISYYAVGKAMFYVLSLSVFLVDFKKVIWQWVVTVTTKSNTYSKS